MKNTSLFDSLLFNYVLFTISDTSETPNKGLGPRVTGGDLPGVGRPRDHPGRLRPLQAGAGRDSPLPDSALLLLPPRVLPDRVHGRVHAVRQHRGPLRGRRELQGRFAMGVHQLRLRRLPGEDEAPRVRRTGRPDQRLPGQRV